MTIQLSIRLPEAEDFTNLGADGDLEDAVMDICVKALLDAGYEIFTSEQPEYAVTYETWPFGEAP